MWSLSAAHYSSTAGVGSSSFSRALHVLKKVSVLCGVCLVPGDFSSIVPPGCGSPRLPLQHLRLFRQLGYQRPPPLVDEGDGLYILRRREVGKGGPRGVRLLPGDFPGVIPPGSRSPGCPLQSLGLLRQLCHRHALLLVPEGVKRNSQMFWISLSSTDYYYYNLANTDSWLIVCCQICTTNLCVSTCFPHATLFYSATFWNRWV